MWYKLSIQSRMFIVLSLLLVMSSIISITKQSTMTINSELEQLKSEILPSHLESLASQISSEILPFITASELMTNNKFVEEWVKTGAANSQLPLIESTLGSTKKMLGSDFTFYVVEGKEGTDYLGYGDKFSTTPLKDYPFKSFYPSFLATGKKYELIMDGTPEKGFMLFINYRSDAINPKTNKPYSVAGLGIKADKFVNLVTKLKIGDHGRAMLVSDKGEIQINAEDATLDEVHTEDLIGLLSDKEKVIIQEVIINKHSYYLGSLWVPLLNRFLVVEVPRAQITDPIHSQLWDLSIFILISFIISLVVLYFVVRTLTAPLKNIEIDLRRVTGDLNLDYKIKTVDKAEVGSLANTINSLLFTIKESLITVNDAVTTTDKAIVDLNKQSDELHIANIEERESLGNILSATNEITEQSSQMTELASKAGILSSQGNTELGHASNEVHNSLQYLEELEKDMLSSQANINGLNGHIENIVAVLEIITSISDQTNLLALNAAIEAARAGDHGRGFAVVSDEVRLLSQRTSESTGKIQDIINQLKIASNDVTAQIQVACDRSVETLDGQKLVADKVEALNGFLQQLFEMNKQIEEKAEIQNSSVTEINQTLDSLSAQTEQTGNLFNESRQATEAIGNEMGGLKVKLEQFKGL